MTAIDPETLVEWLESGNGRPPEERDTQQIALEQLCMILLMSDNVDRCFDSCPPRLFIKALCGVLVDETAPDSILEIVARALTYYLDVSSECARQIVAVDRTVVRLCSKLRFDESASESRVSLDLAEQCVKVLESLCTGEPGAVYQHGTLGSALEFIVKAVKLSANSQATAASGSLSGVRMRVHRDALRSAMNIVARLSGRVEPSDRRVAEYVASLSTLLSAGAAAKRDGTRDASHSDDDAATFIAERALGCFRSLAERFVRRGADALVLLSDALVQFALDALRRLADDETPTTAAAASAAAGARTRTRSCQGSLGQGFLLETTRRMRTESVNVAALTHADAAAAQRGAAEQQREAAAAECAANALGVLLAACRGSGGASRRLLARGDELFAALECGLLAADDRVAHAATRLCDLLALLIVDCDARSRADRILPLADAPASTPAANVWPSPHNAAAAAVVSPEGESEPNAEETGSECETETDEREELPPNPRRSLPRAPSARPPAAAAAAAARPDDGATANRRLIDAIRNGEDERVAASLASADVNANWTDEVGQTLLNWAAAFGTRATCSLLLRRGADPNRGARSSSLHYASCFGRVSIVRLLVRHGADPALRDEDGRLPVEKARERVAVAATTQPPAHGAARLADTPSHRDVVAYLENAANYLAPFCAFVHENDADDAEQPLTHTHESDADRSALLRAFCLRMLPAFATVYRARVDSDSLRGAMLVLVSRTLRACVLDEATLRAVLQQHEQSRQGDEDGSVATRLVRLFCDAVSLEDEPEDCDTPDDETAKSLVNEELGGAALPSASAGVAKRRLLAVRMLHAAVTLGEREPALAQLLADQCVRTGALDTLRRLARMPVRHTAPPRLVDADQLTPAGMRRETAWRAAKLLEALQRDGAAASTGDRTRADSTASTLRSIALGLTRALDAPTHDACALQAPLGDLARLLRDDDVSAFELDSSGVVSSLVRLLVDSRCSFDALSCRLAALVAAFRAVDGAAERLVRKVVECLERVERLPVYRYDTPANVATFQLLSRHIQVRVEPADGSGTGAGTRLRSRNELANKLLKIEPLATTGQLRKFVAKRVARDRERERDRLQLSFMRALKRASPHQPVTLSRPRGALTFIATNGHSSTAYSNPARAGLVACYCEPPATAAAGCVRFLRNVTDLLERDATAGLRVEPSSGTAAAWFALDLGLTLVPNAFTLRVTPASALRSSLRFELHASTTGAEWYPLYRTDVDADQEGDDPEADGDCDADADEDADAENEDADCWFVQVARAAPARYLRFVFSTQRTARPASAAPAPFTLSAFDVFGDVISVAEALHFPDSVRRLELEPAATATVNCTSEPSATATAFASSNASRLVRAARRRYATDSRDRKRRCFREAGPESAAPLASVAPTPAPAPCSTSVTSESVSVSVSVSATPSASATWSGVRVTAAGSPSNEASLAAGNASDARARAPADGADLLNRLLERFRADFSTDCDTEQLPDGAGSNPPTATSAGEPRRSTADAGSARHADLLAGLELLRSAFESSLGGVDVSRDRSRPAPFSLTDADADADADAEAEGAGDVELHEGENVQETQGVQMRTASENESEAVAERAELILPFSVEMGMEDEEDECDAEDDEEEELGEHFTQSQQPLSAEHQHEHGRDADADADEDGQPRDDVAQRASEVESERTARLEELVSALLNDELEQHAEAGAADSTSTRRDDANEAPTETCHTVPATSGVDENEAVAALGTSVLRVRRLFAELADALGGADVSQPSAADEAENETPGRLRNERERDPSFAAGWLNEPSTFTTTSAPSRFEQRTAERRRERERERERDTDRVNEAECIVIKRQFSSILPAFDPRPGRHNVNQIQDVTLEPPAVDLLELDRFADAFADASTCDEQTFSSCKADAEADRLVLRLRHVCCTEVDELLLDDDRATILKCVQQLLVRAVDRRFAQRDCAQQQDDADPQKQPCGVTDRFGALDGPLNVSASMHSAAYHRAVADALRHVFDGQFILAFAFRDEAQPNEREREACSASSSLLAPSTADASAAAEPSMNANAEVNVPWSIEYVERNVGGALPKRTLVDYLVAHADAEFLRRTRLAGARRNVLRTRNCASLVAAYRDFVATYPRFIKRDAGTNEESQVAALTCETDADADADADSYSSTTLSPASTCDEPASALKVPAGATINELIRLIECVYLLSDAALDSYSNPSLIDLLRVHPTLKRALEAYRADAPSFFDQDSSSEADTHHAEESESNASDRHTETDAETNHQAVRQKALLHAGKCLSVVPDAFVSEKLSAKLVAQLGETLVTSADALPDWLSTLVADFGSLFAFDARALFFNALAFGTARSLIWLQAHRDVLMHAATRTRCAAYADEFGAFAASLAASASARRAAAISATVCSGDWQAQRAAALFSAGGGDLPLAQRTVIGRLKHERVRVERSANRILNWALALLRFHADRKAALEIEFLDEAGTGLGPSLEFYSLVARQLQRADLALWFTDDDPLLHAASDSSGPDADADESQSEEGSAENNDDRAPPAYFVHSPNGLFPACLPSPLSPAGADSCELPAHGGRCIRFAEAQGASRYRSLHRRTLTLFELVGMLIAKAVQDGRLVDLPLSHVTFKLLVAAARREREREGVALENDKHDLDVADFVDFADFEAIQPYKARFLKRLERTVRKAECRSATSADNKTAAVDTATDTDKDEDELDIEQLGIEFSYLPSSSVYAFESVALPNASDVRASQLSVTNARDFIRETVHFALVDGVREQLGALARGINRVFPFSRLAVFTPRELESVVCGAREPKWTRAELERFVEPRNGFTRASPAFRMLIAVLDRLTARERKAFVRFATGCSALPPGGLANLRPPLTVVRKVLDSDRADPNCAFPSVNTCVHFLKLPDYSNESMLYERLMAACRVRGFHLN